MNKFILMIMFFVSVCIFSADYPKEILERVDSIVNFPENDFSAEYTIVQDVPGQGRTTTVAAVFRRDRIESYSIIITAPSDKKGQGYLKQKNTLWLYDPDSRKFNSTSSKERFQNSNARNSDFTESSLASDYKIVSSEKVKLGKFNCWLLELRSTNNDVTYPKMKIWIDENFLVRKSEDYSLSDKLLRTTIIPSYQKVGEKEFPAKLLYIDHLKGAVTNDKFITEKTQVTVTKASIDKLPDSVFSKTFLEKSGK